jgi:hypothetical protein
MTSPAGTRPPSRPRPRRRLPAAVRRGSPPEASRRIKAALADDEDQAATYTGPGESLCVLGHQARAWLLFATAGQDRYPWVLSTEGWPQHGQGGTDWHAVYRYLDAMPPAEIARLGWSRYPGQYWPRLTAGLRRDLEAQARRARGATAA